LSADIDVSADVEPRLTVKHDTLAGGDAQVPHDEPRSEQASGADQAGVSRRAVDAHECGEEPEGQGHADISEGLACVGSRGADRGDREAAQGLGVGGRRAWFPEET